jgi:hypothetical protein
MSDFERLSSLRPTVVHRILLEARQLQAEGRTLVSLLRGQPDTPTPTHILEAAEKALRDGLTGYPDNQGEAILREAIAEKLWRDNDLTYDPTREILVTDGATAGIFTALAVLVQPGDDVLLPDPIYDAYASPIAIWGGRPVPVPSAISGGRFMIDRAALETACTPRSRVLVSLLHQLVPAATPIVACEPSCILTIKDDYPALLKGELRAKAQAVAERCFTFEEFLENRLDESAVAFRPGPQRLLVQGHCHQRSLVGMKPTLKLLRRIPGAEVIDLDAGCCGMAGSFGYEKEHYEISRLVGEQRLFPAIRQVDAETIIVAPGFSCRHQIEHFTGRRAVHPATLLRELCRW